MARRRGTPNTPPSTLATSSGNTEASSTAFTARTARHWASGGSASAIDRGEQQRVARRRRPGRTASPRSSRRPSTGRCPGSRSRRTPPTGRPCATTARGATPNSAMRADDDEPCGYGRSVGSSAPAHLPMPAGAEARDRLALRARTASGRSIGLHVCTHLPRRRRPRGQARPARRSTTSELDTFTAQLGAILDHAADVEALDLDRRGADLPPVPAGQRAAARRRGRHPRPRRGPGRRPPGRGRPVPGAHHPGGGAVSRPGDRPSRSPPPSGPASARPSTSLDAHLAAHRGHRGRRPRLQHRSRPTAPAAAAEAVDRRVAAGEDLGPLAGVPVALKDNLCTRGVATTCSSRILEGWVPPYDATVVQRLAARRRRHGRQDQPRRVRHGLVHRELGLRPHPQPRRPQPGCPAARRAARPPRSPPASPRSRSAPTPAAPSASPPRCAAWSA